MCWTRQWAAGWRGSCASGSSTRSRRVGSGTLFVGLPGTKVDGGQFWPEVLAAGACAAVIGPRAAAAVPPGPDDAVIVAECGKLPKALHPSLFEAAAHMVLADGKLTDAECLRLAALRAFLGIPEAISLAVVAAVAHAEPTLKVQLTKAAAG